MKCKNIECKNEVKKGRVYCSLKCRNIYVNTHLRDYSKVSKTLRDNSKNVKLSYNSNPKKCKECGLNLPYEKRNNLFCNHSCSASYNNKTREVTSYTLSNEGLKNIRLSNQNRMYERVDEYKNNPSKCNKCGVPLPYNVRNNKRCSKCFKSSFRTDEYYIYRRNCKFKFNLSDYPVEFDFELIKEHGWYKAKNRGDNLYGVSRDHIYSVKDGFLNNINPLIIAHPANCRLMLHSDNVSKYTDSDITIEELLERIKKWDDKYK